MKTLEELTDTTSTTVDDIVPELWSKDLELAAQAKRVARNLIRVNTDLRTSGGDIIHIPKQGKITASSLTEGTDITPAALAYSTLDLTPVEIGAAVRITKEAVEKVQIDLLKDATDQLAEALAQREDQDILAALAGATGHILYGGAKNADASLSLGDVLTTDMIASGVAYIREDNFEPDTLIIHPTTERELLKLAAFTNASTYGKDDVVQKGEIGKYLGLKVISTTNVERIGDASVSAHSSLIISGKRSGALAVARDATIDTDYEVLKRSHLIVGTMREDAGLLNDLSIAVLKVSDA